MSTKDKYPKKIRKIGIKSVRTLSAEEYEQEEADAQRRKNEMKYDEDSTTGEKLFNGDVRGARLLFLRGMSLVYFIAFMSIYLQVEGLYGTNGITPVKAELKLSTRSSYDCMKDKKTLLCYLAPELGLRPHYAMELVALGGIVLSGFGTLCVNLCVAPVMLLLWLGYLSIYQVGGVFMWFQWDILLLEAGILAVIAAPWFPTKSSHAVKPRDMMSMWMVQWLLFRLMFASGVVKLQSGCPTWWGLDALQFHFQSQCLPTPVAHYVHHFPAWILRAMVVGTYFIEIAAPLLFFSPFVFLKRIGFWLQVSLQLAIIATGNYNFFNLLTIVLCFSLLDSGFFGTKKSNRSGSFIRFITRAFQFIVLGLMIHYTIKFFGLAFTADYTSVQSKITFTRTDFEVFISYAVPYSIVVGFITLVSKLAQAVVISVFDMPSIWQKFTSLTSTLFYGFICFSLFAITCEPFSSIHPETNSVVWPGVKELHNNVSRYHITSSYGLFRRMTGVENGRPEVILEYADDMQGPWKEYNFLYKPGDVSVPPSIVAPHQPRLDWQMWFAALGTYHDNPWLVSLAYRVLQGEPSVQKLLSPIGYPKVPPKYVRASLYQYTFTKPLDKNWWSRTRNPDNYLPIFTATHPPLVDFIKKLGYLEPDLPRTVQINKKLTNLLDLIRTFTQAYRPEHIIWGSVLSLLILLFTSKLF